MLSYEGCTAGRQGAAPITLVFNQAFNPVHTIARLCGRGGAIYDLTPAGSSGFADDTVFHTSGLDAVQHIMDEMLLLLSALRTDKMLPPTLKDVVIKIGVVSVFRYSAGLVHGQRQS